MGVNDKRNSFLADLDIDNVKYLFNNQVVHCSNVEIEAKLADESMVLATVTQDLLSRYYPQLRIWKYSKLATGKAIERLLSSGRLGELLDANKNLKPYGCNRIDEILKDTRIPFEWPEI